MRIFINENLHSTTKVDYQREEVEKLLKECCVYHTFTDDDNLIIQAQKCDLDEVVMSELFYYVINEFFEVNLEYIPRDDFCLIVTQKE